jgi:hypothetical protein
MNKFASATIMVALVSTSLSAQTMETTTEMPQEAMAEKMNVADAAPQNLTLNSGTPITLAVSEEVNSSTHDAGDIFKLTVLNDVMVGQKVVIPKGTPATGEITWRTGKGAFGKSGKLEFSLRSINLNGNLIPITGDFRQEGEGNTVATGVGVIAIGVFAGFITGKKARLPVGRELMAQLPQAIPFGGNGQLSSSYNSTAAMADAEGKTELGQCKAAAKAMPEKKRKSALEDCFKEKMD